MNTFKYILGTAAVMGVIGTASIALADREDLRLAAEAKISLIQAIQAAEKDQGGKAIEANLDDDSFKPAYEVNIVKDNRIFDVQVDAVTGEVTGVREDLDD